MPEQNDDPDEITISDEDLERAMRVYTPEEAMDFLHAGKGLPSTREPTRAGCRNHLRAARRAATKVDLAQVGHFPFSACGGTGIHWPRCLDHRPPSSALPCRR